MEFHLSHLLKLHVISIVSEVPCKRAVAIFVLQGWYKTWTLGKILVVTGYNSSCFFFLFSLFLICISGIQKLPNINELTTWKDSQKICLSADSYGHRSEGIHINLSLPPSPQIYSHLMKWLIRKVVLGLPVSVKPFLKFLILKMKQPKCSLFKKPIVMCWSSSYSEVSNNKMVISRPQIMKQFGIDFRLAPELECWSFFFPFCLSSQD